MYEVQSGEGSKDDFCIRNKWMSPLYSCEPIMVKFLLKQHSYERVMKCCLELEQTYHVVM